MRFLIVMALCASVFAADKIEVHGHRGARALRPENTMPAFEYAIGLGVDVLELDLGVTKDNVVVVSHDPVLKAPICKGPKAEAAIRESTLAELREWDCGAVQNPLFTRQQVVPATRIPTLDEVFRLATRGKFRFNIETKINPAQPAMAPLPAEFVRLVLEVIRKHHLESRVILQSFDFRTLHEMKKVAPEITLAALYSGPARNFVDIAKEGGAGIISPEYRLVTPEQVIAAHAAGLKVIPWTANLPADWDRLIAAGVDAIITDDPAGLIGILSTRREAAAPEIRWAIPERTRLLVNQRLDLVLEARGVAPEMPLRISVNGKDWSDRFSKPLGVDLDCNGSQNWAVRTELVSFPTAGTFALKASVGGMSAERRIEVLPFSLGLARKNIILFIGDGTGTAYRDAARIVAKSVPSADGRPGLREGFFDQLQNMDKMPVTGSVMTYSLRSLVPDSASTASAWSTGNKTTDGTLSVWPDGTDCHAKGPADDVLKWASDNPRIETMWEYLKRLHGYRTGVVTTSYVADATSAGEGSHVLRRGFSFEIARQFLENPMLSNQPSYDVLMGGGLEDFEPAIRADGRDLVREFEQKGYRTIRNAYELESLPPNQDKIIGLFRRPNKVARAASGLNATANGNLNVAYDRLKLTRPGSEPLPDFGEWTDQPFLADMTRQAIRVLSGARGTQPFVLLVEGASVDKQSHSNHAAGTIWDAIEFDQTIGLARAWASARPRPDTLILATADHDQTMTILGVSEVSDKVLTDRQPMYELVTKTPAGETKLPIYGDLATNIRGTNQWSASQDRTLIDDFPDYQDANGDGFPENREVDGKGSKRIVVGFRNGDHAGSTVPVSAEGPGAWMFTGLMDQTDLMFKMAAALGETKAEDELLRRVYANPRNPRTPGK
jgi:alkaline phosphatase/glycerophosphoryl diester phosphodiesterase